MRETGVPSGTDDAGDGPTTGGSVRLRTAVLVGGLLLGLLVASGLNAALGIEFRDREAPSEPVLEAGEVAPPGPFEVVDALVVPEGDAWLELGAERLADALEVRTGRRPRLVAADDGDDTGRVVVIGAADPDQGPEGGEAFSIERTDRGLEVRARQRPGQIAAVYWLADQVLVGTPEAELAPRSVAPALPRRLVDLGGLGVPVDTWDRSDYSHDVRNLHDALLPEAPYVDDEAFTRIEADLTGYLDHMLAYGNNGIVQSGFLELIDFDDVGDGHEIYPAGSAYRARHAALREHFGRLWSIADEAGMEVYLNHTQLALTPPLERYLLDRFGTIDAEDPRMWEVYKLGLAELFERFEEIDGIVLRIGEAGAIYDPADGLEYTTRLEVRTDTAVRTMLEAFLEVAEEYDRTIVFRTWTVGIGEVGHLHHRPEVYERVLGAVDSPNLIVSTKYVQGDFYRYIPFNETLLTGHHRRIVELQNRLEFEGFMAFPNLIGPLHGASLARIAEANPNLEGVWQWNQSGGPQQAGPMSLYPFHGFWHNIDANVYTTSRHAWDPTVDPRDATADWVRRSFGDDPTVVTPLLRMLSLSREATAKGLYVSAYAEKLVLALGLETTPMMWIFEWDIVSGSNSVLSTTYYTARDDVDAAIAEGREAAVLAREMRRLAGEVPAELVDDPQMLAGLLASLDYQVDLFETLAAWRATFLRYYEWLDTGDPVARAAWQAGYEEFSTRMAAHVEHYGDDLDFPAYSFFAVERGLAHATRTETMAWLARGLLLALLLAYVVGALALAGRIPARVGVRAARALTRTTLAPGRIEDLRSMGSTERTLLVLAPAAWLALASVVFSSVRSIHYPLLMGTVIAAFGGVLAAVGRRRLQASLVALVTALLPVVGVLVAVTAVRGPGMFWYRMWTDATFRLWFVTLSTALVVWLLYVIAAVLRHECRRRLPAVAGALLAGAGAILVAVGIVPAVGGLEEMLTGLNDEMAVLPLGLSMILGITVHLDIPTALPAYLIVTGSIVTVGGAVLLWVGRDPAVTR